MGLNTPIKMAMDAHMLVVLLISSCLGTLHNDWEEWKRIYEKKYLDEKEDIHRFKIWDYNRQYIDDHNSLGESYSLKINDFADLVSLTL